VIGYISGKFLAAEESGAILVDVNGVGYALLVSSRVSLGLVAGAPIELYVHTNLRENALELFGFSTSWEKKVFQLLTTVSGVGPRTALSVLGGLEPEMILSAIVREDRATLNSVSGIGKKTAERLIVELGDKARVLLADRPRAAFTPGAPKSVAAADVAAQLAQQASGVPAAPVSKKRGKSAAIPPQGASASSVAGMAGLDIADLWNEALAALMNLGYRDSEAISAIKLASAKSTESGEAPSLEKLIKSSLQLMSRGI
jgi:Holliday junction DNA helicase RuvA